MKSELVFSPAGELTGIKQTWAFDDAFSAFALQGMAKQKNGTYGDDVLKPLAQVNIESLKEYDYFVYGKTATSKIAFNEPVDYYLTYENETLVLHFTLPLKTPLPAKGRMAFEIYDPSMFVAFSFAEKDPVSATAMPGACTKQVISPDQADTSQLGEEFFANPTAAMAGYAKQFADSIIVACPK